VRSAFPLPPSVNKEAAPTREGDPFDRLPADLQVIRLWLDMRLWEHWDRAKSSPDSLRSWRKEFLLELAETDAGGQETAARKASCNGSFERPNRDRIRAPVSQWCRPSP
jgi:hypothetical protein